MKNKFFLILLISLAGSIAVNAQSKEKKAVQDMTARREKRDKQVAGVRSLVHEQKAQQASEKKAEAIAAFPAPGAAGFGQSPAEKKRTDVSIPAVVPTKQEN
jgi:hypothetical protein